MLRGIFVTGTDTAVGKTVVSAALLHRYRSAARLRYWKPVETGIEADDDTATVRALSGASADRILARGVRLPRPLSPHLSATLAGFPLSIATITAYLNEPADVLSGHPASGFGFQDRWIVEGAGGVLVPLNDRELIVDLIFMLGLPAVVVARSGLGTINHTLMTIEALRARAVPVAGVVMVGAENKENRLAIESYGHVTVVGELPRLEPLTAGTLQAEAERIDPAGALAPYFS